MKHSSLAIAALLGVFSTLTASAQTAYRCDQNGTTVYSEKPCPPAATGKAVAPTQDTAEQRAASQAANAQMRKDNADLNKRLSDREKLEARERAEQRKAAASAARAKAPVAKSGKTLGKTKAPKAKRAPAPAKPKAKGRGSKGKAGSDAVTRSA